MIEPAKRYDLTIHSNMGRGLRYGVLIKRVSGTLIEFEHSGQTHIVNTASSDFVSAILSVRQDERKCVMEIDDVTGEVSIRSPIGILKRASVGQEPV
jgi:hypothetical protein